MGEDVDEESIEYRVTNMLMAQLGVLFRALVVGAVGYGAWGMIAGGTTWRTYGIVVAVLWAATNVVFWITKMYRPDVLTMAETAEDRL